MTGESTGIARLRETAENATPGPRSVPLPGGLIHIDTTMLCREAEYLAAWSPEVALAFVDYFVKRRELDEAEAAWGRTPMESGEAFMRARAEFLEAEARLLALVGEDT